MNKMFPKDCAGCKYFYSYDLSIDDYTNICKKNGWQADDMDAYGAFSVLYCRFHENCYEPYIAKEEYEELKYRCKDEE